jgi:hypothetical protein
LTTPPNASDPDALDALILASADADWCKVAVFIAKVVDAAKARGTEASGQAVAQRVYALVEAGTLEAKGNVRRWRAGEVRKVA